MNRTRTCVPTYREAFHAATKGPDNDGRDLWAEADPFRNMMLVTMMEAEGYDADTAKGLIHDAACSLKRFHTDNIRRAKDCTRLRALVRFDTTRKPGRKPDPRGGTLFVAVFEWWGDPNEREVCSENLQRADPPAGFLLPYWMGRYFGYLNETL